VRKYRDNPAPFTGNFSPVTQLFPVGNRRIDRCSVFPNSPEFFPGGIRPMERCDAGSKMTRRVPEKKSI
jgi:hypothetical protein